MFSLLFTLMQYFLWGIFAYNFAISIFGWFRKTEEPGCSFPAKNRFAVIIPAHNEEAVIGNAVRSLKKLNYPAEMYDIFVIADNCTDRTAEKARENGALVYERFDTERKGKGYSLEWMFERLFKLDREYEAICVLDADNLVAPDFLTEMNKQLCLGHKVIQGYLDSKNPYDTWISGNYSISYWISNRLFQLPRHYLGLNCQLGGTGFVMSTALLKELGWGATCLTEDLEFSIRLVLSGERVAWAHDAVVYDEKPLFLWQSWKQRKRWMQGHCDCAVRYLKKLLAKAFRDGDVLAFDLALYLVQPFIIVLNGLGLVFTVMQMIMQALSGISGQAGAQLCATAIFMALAAYANIIFVYIEGKLSKEILKYFILFPVFSLTWIPIIIQGFIERDRKEWVHTIHTRAIEIHEIEGMEKTG